MTDKDLSKDIKAGEKSGKAKKKGVGIIKAVGIASLIGFGMWIGQYDVRGWMEQKYGSAKDSFYGMVRADPAQANMHTIIAIRNQREKRPDIEIDVGSMVTSLYSEMEPVKAAEHAAKYLAGTEGEVYEHGVSAFVSNVQGVEKVLYIWKETFSAMPDKIKGDVVKDSYKEIPSTQKDDALTDILGNLSEGQWMAVPSHAAKSLTETQYLDFAAATVEESASLTGLMRRVYDRSDVKERVDKLGEKALEMGSKAMDIYDGM